MYEPQLFIHPEIYPLLLRWGRSVGYRVKTDVARTILYDLSNIDPVRGRELEAEHRCGGLDRDEAYRLIEDLSTMSYNHKDNYEPDYSPPVQIDEDMYEKQLKPKFFAAGDYLKMKHEGIFYEVLGIRPGRETLCRSEVTAIVRGMEYERRMAPFLVLYERGSTWKMWSKGADSEGAALEIMKRERARHAPNSEWRIYHDRTKKFRRLHQPFADQRVKPDGWLWLRIWHPGALGADYWEQGRYKDVDALRQDLVEAEARDIYAVPAVYVCSYREGPEEETEKLDTLRGLNTAPEGSILGMKDAVYKALLPVVDDEASIEQAWPEILKAALHSCRFLNVGRTERGALKQAIRNALISARDIGYAQVGVFEIESATEYLIKQVLGIARLQDGPETDVIGGV